MAEQEVKLIIKAWDETKAAFNSINDNLKKLEQNSKSIANTLKQSWTEAAVKIAAVVAAVKSSWDRAYAAAQYQEHVMLLQGLAASYNSTAKSIINSIQTVSNGLIGLQTSAEVASSSLAKGLDPETLIKLARASVTLSDFMGTTVEETFRRVSEAVVTGRERTLQLAVGVIDLEAKYGEATSTMSEYEKAMARANVVIERAEALQKATATAVESTADKMERLIVRIKDLQLHLGTGLLKAGAVAMGVFQGVAGYCLRLSGALFNVISYFFKLTDAVGITKNKFEEWQLSGKAALEGGLDLYKKAKENFELAGSTAEEIASAQKKIDLRDIFPFGKDKKDKAELARYKQQYEEFLADLDSARKSGFQKELAEVNKWELEKLNRLKTFRDKNIINEEVYREKKLEIEKMASNNILDIYEKYAQKEVDIENEINQQLLTDYEKRIRQIEDWEDAKVKELEELYNQDFINFNEFEEQKTRIKQAALHTRLKIEQEYQTKLKEMQISLSIAEVKRAEKLGSITEEESIREQIRLYEEMLSMYQKQADEAAKAIALAETSTEKMALTEIWLQIQQTISGILDKITELKTRFNELTGTPAEAIFQGIDNYIKSIGSSFERLRDATTDILKGMENTFTSFFDITSKNFLNFGQLAMSILNDIYKSVVRVLIINPLMASIGNLFGSTFGQRIGAFQQWFVSGRWHKGGYIPRFHYGGISSDEIPAILQKGEYVVSRKGVEMLNRINEGKPFGNVNVVVNVENQTGVPVTAEQKSAKFDGEKYIIGVVLKNIEQYGVLRHAISGVK